MTAKHILIGNGINIQYGGAQYLNSNIINRTMANAKNGHYEFGMQKTIAPNELHKFFALLRNVVIKEVLEGKYDQYVLSGEEKRALCDFHERYPCSNTDICQIGFEDYFLVFRLLHNKFNEDDIIRNGSKTALKRLFLDAIYNNGHLSAIHEDFPEGLISFLNEYDTLFTVNYDANIERATGRDAVHLHGQFDVLEDVYDPNSFRNQLPDRPSDNFDIPDEWRHTYCNAIMDFSKDFQVAMNSHANAGLQKLVAAATNNADLLGEIENWKDDSNTHVRNLYYAYKAKQENANLELREYPLSKIDGIFGHMHILGLSPNNDTHILEHIRANNGIDMIRYYYHSKEEGQRTKEYFGNKKVECLDVRDLWDSFEE